MARLLLSVWALVVLFPFLWMLFGSLVPNSVLLEGGSLFAAPLGLEHYHRLLEDPRLLGWIFQSLGIAATVALGQVLSAAALGYVLAKVPFWGRQGWLTGLGLMMMVPGQLLVIPLFLLLVRLDLVDHSLAVILPALVTPFGVLLMASRMKQLPDELLDAARIDGCSEAGIFYRIALPLSAPVAATLAIFAFIGQWNSFLWPLLVLYSSEKYTLPVGLATLQGQHEVDFGLLLAGASLAALPMVLVFLGFQKFFTRGGLAGAVKG